MRTTQQVNVTIEVGDMPGPKIFEPSPSPPSLYYLFNHRHHSLTCFTHSADYCRHRWRCAVSRKVSTRVNDDLMIAKCRFRRSVVRLAWRSNRPVRCGYTARRSLKTNRQRNSDSEMKHGPEKQGGFCPIGAGKNVRRIRLASVRYSQEKVWH